MLEPRSAQRLGPVDQATPYGHSRTRTTSSNQNFHIQGGGGPGQLHPQPLSVQSHAVHASTNVNQRGNMQNRRSPSINTFSTSSSFAPPAAYRTSSTTDLRRSTSSRSGGTSTPAATGYVALLRKQKATVWCDRAQYEDPRAAHQLKVAKMRANLEVSGGRNSTYGSMGARTSTGLSATGKVVGKIRHHGKAPTTGYVPGQNHVGVGGVPMRLSATEVEAESSGEEDNYPAARSQHRRTGSSGRSSSTSGPRAFPHRPAGHPASQKWSPGDTPERPGSWVEDGKPGDDSFSTMAKSIASGSSAEKADNVAELPHAPRLASNQLLNAALHREKSVKNPEELRRRGSVDERTATLTSGRLFIANPD